MLVDIIVDCKWCKSKAVHSTQIQHGVTIHVIRCTNPKCGCALGRRTKDDVHKHWNHHHSRPHVPGRR
jgi:hypothetical protein